MVGGYLGNSERNQHLSIDLANNRKIWIYNLAVQMPKVQMLLRPRGLPLSRIIAHADNFKSLYIIEAKF